MRLLFIYSILFFSSLGLAKEVTLRWKPVRGAQRYQIEVQKNGAVVLTDEMVAQEKAWTKSFETGVYYYRVRALDFQSRPGEWTPLQYFIVPPNDTIEAKLPDDKDTFILHRSLKIHFEWTELHDIDTYVLEVRRGTNSVFHYEGSKTSADFAPTDGGEFDWDVRPLFKATNNEVSIPPAKLLGAASKTRHFVVGARVLAAPKLKFPTKTLNVLDDRKAVFSWETVPGAESYEFKLVPKSRRGPASTESTITQKTNESSIEVVVPRDGRYVWSVRALAGVSELENKDPEVLGAPSSSELSVSKYDPRYLFHVGISGVYWGYNYIDGPANYTQNGLTAAGMAVNADIIRSTYGVRFEFQDIGYGHGNNGASWNDIGILGIYHPKTSRAWRINLRAGVEKNDFLAIFPSPTNHSSIGPAFEGEAYYGLSQYVYAGLVANYYYPLAFQQSGDQADGAGDDYSAGIGINIKLGGIWSAIRALDFDMKVFYSHLGMKLPSSALTIPTATGSISANAFPLVQGGLIWHFGDE